MDIWIYWQDAPGTLKAPYIELCQQIICDKVSGQVHLLDDQAIHKFVELPSVSHLTLVQRADYYRSKLLLQYGGIYLDSDTILLQDIVPILEPLIDKHGFVEAGMACLGATPGHPLVAGWVERNEKLIERKSSFSFSELGGDSLDVVKQGYQGPAFDFREEGCLHRIIPVEYTEWWQFFQDRQLESLDSPDQIGVMLFNAYMGKFLAMASRSRILNSQTLLARVFRKALGSD